MKHLFIIIIAFAVFASCSSPPSLSSTALCGDDAAPPVDVAPDAPGIRPLTLILGQSNAAGNGLASEIDPSWTQPFPAVTLSSKVAKNISDPPVIWLYEGALAPRLGKFGAELSMGRALPNRDIAICAGNGASLAVNLDPNGTWPSGGPNFHTQCVSFAHATEASHSTRVETILWFQGESDATQLAWANAYLDNLAEVAGLLLAEFPCARFFYYRLKTPGTYAATVRAAHEAFAATNTPWVTMVDVDALPTFGQHFTAQGYLQLGELFADVIADATPRCP